MNNRLRKILSLILVVVLLCTFGACSEETRGRDRKEREEPTDEEAIVGKWVLAFDDTDSFVDGFIRGLSSGMGEEDAAEVASYFEFDDLLISYIIEFDEDGTYIVSLDEDALRDEFSDLKEQFRDGLYRMYDTMLTEQGIDYSEDELIELVDMAVEELLSEDNVEYIIESYGWEDLEGQYLLHDGKISFSDDEDTEPDTEEYDTYEIDDDTLTLKKCHRDVDDDENDRYPIKMYRD